MAIGDKSIGEGIIGDSAGLVTVDKTVSIDALIRQSGIAQTAGLDALIQKRMQTAAVSIDANVAAAEAVAVILDAIIKQAGIAKTANLDGLIQQAALTATLDIDAFVQRFKAKTLSIDAVIASGQAVTLDIDAIVQLATSAGVSLDGLIQALVEQVVSMDAVIAPNGAELVLVDLDAAIQQATTATASLDAGIQKTDQAATVGLDGLIAVGGLTSSTGANGLIQRHYDLPATWDPDQITGPVTLNGIRTIATLPPAGAGGTAIGTLTRSSGIRYFEIFLQILSPRAGEYLGSDSCVAVVLPGLSSMIKILGDGYIYVDDTQMEWMSPFWQAQSVAVGVCVDFNNGRVMFYRDNFATSSWISAPGLLAGEWVPYVVIDGGGAPTKSISAAFRAHDFTYGLPAGALPWQDYFLSNSVYLNAAIQDSFSAAADLDALIQRPGTASAVVDALVQKNGLAAAVVDALIQQPGAASAVVDALIASGMTVSAAMDALLAVLVSSNVGIDALVQVSRSATCGMDASIWSSLIQGFTDSVDAPPRLFLVDAPGSVRTVDSVRKFIN